MWKHAGFSWRPHTYLAVGVEKGAVCITLVFTRLQWKPKRREKLLSCGLTPPPQAHRFLPSLSGSSQKRAALSELGALWKSYNTARFQSPLVWKKKKKAWGVWVRDMEVFHYVRANPATAENRLLLCSSLKWKCESTDIVSETGALTKHSRPIAAPESYNHIIRAS